MSLKIPNGADLNNQKIVNLADGSSATDAVTFQQFQAGIRGLDWKDSVRAATTANITLSGTQTIDGVAVIANNRVLVKDQTTGADNGIYVCAAGAWSRAADADTSAEVTSGMAMSVEEGTNNGDKAFMLTTNNPIVLATTALTFSILGGGSTYTAGVNGGLTLAGSAFSILLDSASGLVLGSGGIKVDPSVIPHKYSANCVVTTNPQTFNHNLGTIDVVVMVKEVSSLAVVLADVVITDTNNISVNFGGAPSAAQYRVVVIG